jgi:hypothetical protein
MRELNNRPWLPTPTFNSSSGCQDCKCSFESRRRGEARRSHVLSCLSTHSCLSKRLALCVLRAVPRIPHSSLAHTPVWSIALVVAKFSLRACMLVRRGAVFALRLAMSCIPIGPVSIPIYPILKPETYVLYSNRTRVYSDAQTSAGRRPSRSCGLGLCMGQRGTWRRKCSTEEEWVRAHMPLPHANAQRMRICRALG